MHINIIFWYILFLFKLLHVFKNSMRGFVVFYWDKCLKIYILSIVKDIAIMIRNFEIYLHKLAHYATPLLYLAHRFTTNIAHLSVYNKMWTQISISGVKKRGCVMNYFNTSWGFLFWFCYIWVLDATFDRDLLLNIVVIHKLISIINNFGNCI